MIKKCILLTLLICPTIMVSGQKLNTKNLLKNFELVGGSSFSKNSGYLSDYDSKIGYTFGIGYYQNITKSFSLNFRALYETKGSAAYYSYGLTDANGTTEVTDKYTAQFKYVSLYLLPTFQLGPRNNIYISAGAYYSFLQNLSVNTYRTNKNTGDLISDYTTTNKDYFTPDFDAGISVQLGYSFKLNEKSQLLLQAFSNRGIKDLYNPAMGSQRNNTFGLTASYRRK